jgi:hypothetical protein
MENAKTIAYLLPVFLTFYLSFFQTQRLWLTKKFWSYCLFCILFSVLWLCLPFIPINNKKLFIAPLFWVVCCYIGQVLHNSFSKQENKSKPIVFVVYSAFIATEFYQKSINRKPNFLDFCLSGVVIVGWIILMLLSYPMLNKFFG